MRAMTKSSFALGKDASGKEFIYQKRGEADKNHNVNDDPFDTTGEGRVYATHLEKCPVQNYKTYISHLNPSCEFLWQKARPSDVSDQTVWFCNMAVGEKILGNMMANLSTKYSLSQKYTNHSLRVTSLQVLDDAQIDARQVIRVSGHKNTDSLLNYARRLSAARKRKISSVLSNSAMNNPDPATSTPQPTRSLTTTTAVPSPAIDINFDLVDVPKDRRFWRIFYSIRAKTTLIV